MKVLRLPKGEHIAPLPTLKTLKGGEVDRVTPGGLRPSGGRNSYTHLAGQHKRGSSKSDYGDNSRTFHASSKWKQIEREFRLGLRVYDSAL